MGVSGCPGSPWVGLEWAWGAQEGFRGSLGGDPGLVLGCAGGFLEGFWGSLGGAAAVLGSP